MDTESIATFTGRRLEKANISDLLAGTVVSILIPVVVWVIIAVVYKGKVTDQRPPFQGGGQTSPYLDADKICACCGCCGGEFDVHMCLHAWCCYTFRAGDTFEGA